jgi:hypothetical protein
MTMAVTRETAFQRQAHHLRAVALTAIGRFADPDIDRAQVRLDLAPVVRRLEVRRICRKARLSLVILLPPACVEARSLMRYALLIYETPEDFARRNPAGEDRYLGAWRAYYKAVVEAGIYAGGNALDAPGTGTTVRQRDGKRLIQDGPYAGTKEQLGGFMLLELPSLDAALEWAARCPAAASGAMEVRPLAPEADLRVTDGQPQP